MKVHLESEISGIEVKHILLFVGLIILGGLTIRYVQSNVSYSPCGLNENGTAIFCLQSVDDYNKFCEQNKYSEYCQCSTTPVTGNYDIQLDLGGVNPRFHGDTWVQADYEPPRIVKCMRGRIQIMAECPYGTVPASGGYECASEPSGPSQPPTGAGDTGVVLYLIAGGLVVFFVVGYIIYSKM